MIVAHAGSLGDVLADVFEAAGCSRDEATHIATSLVDANLAGHDSHGVVRTQRYVDWLRAGVQVANQSIEVLADGGAFAVVDGRFGMGQWIGPQAVRLGIDRANEHGVAIVALRHAGHLGRIGEWAEMAAAAGLVSIHFVNVSSSRMVAPFGGIDRRMATNPVCIGVPRGGGRPPVLLDFATSVVAEGKVLVAFDGGPAVPEDSLIGADGRQTNDPRTLYGERKPGSYPNPMLGTGALRAMGEHKGSGLAVMCELLAGALTGSGAAGPDQHRFCNGMLSIYLSPDRFTGDGVAFAAEVDAYIDWLKTATPAIGVDEVLAPGEPEQRKRAWRLEHGVELPDETWASIVSTASSVGVAIDDARVSVDARHQGA